MIFILNQNLGCTLTKVINAPQFDSGISHIRLAVMMSVLELNNLKSTNTVNSTVHTLRLMNMHMILGFATKYTLQKSVGVMKICGLFVGMLKSKSL